MSTKLKGPDGATHVQVDGVDYDIGEDGLFDIDNGEHVVSLCEMGFLTEEQTCGVCAELKARFPRVVHGMVQSGINISTVHTAEGLLDIIEGQLPPTPEQIEAEEGTIVGETVIENEPAEGEGEGEGEGEQTDETDPGVNDQSEGTETSGEQSGEGDEGASETGGEGEGAPAADAADAEQPAADADAGDTAGADAPVTDDAAPADGGPAPDAVEDPLADVPKDDIGNPTFNKMNRAGIHAWLVANGGTELKPDSAKDDLITEAEQRADALTKKD